VNDTVVTVIAQQVSGRTCAKTEQTVEIGGTACLNPDAVIGHNLGPPLDSPSIIPGGSNNLAPRWLTPQIEEIPWDDHWHLVYLRLLKSDEGVVSETAS
jgi:hypothetical protein